MEFITLYLLTALIFLMLDAVMLTMVVAPLFRRHIGHMMLETPRVRPTAIFYAFYLLGLLILVSWPAYHDFHVVRAFWQGAIVGAMAYGTYEFTNYATLSDWHPRMVITDGLWGMVLTAVSAAGGVWITLLIFD